MSLGLAQLERITADIQANDLDWVEVADGSYFKALTIHVPTNTVAYAFRMDPGAPDFPPHFHISRAMSFTASISPTWGVSSLSFWKTAARGIPRFRPVAVPRGAEGSRAAGAPRRDGCAGAIRTSRTLGLHPLHSTVPKHVQK